MKWFLNSRTRIRNEKNGTHQNTQNLISKIKYKKHWKIDNFYDGKWMKVFSGFFILIHKCKGVSDYKTRVIFVLIHQIFSQQKQHAFYKLRHLYLSNCQNTRNLYFNKSRWLGLKFKKKLLHFRSVAILSNSQEVVEKNATQSSFNKNVSRPIKVQQLVEYTLWHNFKKSSRL